MVTGSGTQRLVEGHPEAGAVLVGEQQVPAVLVDADQPQVLHARSQVARLC